MGTLTKFDVFADRHMFVDKRGSDEEALEAANDRHAAAKQDEHLNQVRQKIAICTPIMYLLTVLVDCPLNEGDVSY